MGLLKSIKMLRQIKKQARSMHGSIGDLPGTSAGMGDSLEQLGEMLSQAQGRLGMLGAAGNQYLVPSTARLGPGVSVPVKVDANDPAQIAIDWDRAPSAPAMGEIRPVDPTT